MERITLHPAGVKLSRSADHPRKPGKRGKSQGWTGNARRAQFDFLTLLDLTDEQISRLFTYTNTIRDTPETSEEYSEALRQHHQYFQRSGLVEAYNSVKEWQSKSLVRQFQTPHNHGIGLATSQDALERILRHAPEHVIASPLSYRWVDVDAKPYGAQHVAQDYAPIRDREALYGYILDHTGRGLTDPQRYPKDLPPAWIGNVGAVRFTGGSWPLATPLEVEFCAPRVWWQVRRIIGGLALSLARRKLERVEARLFRTRHAREIALSQARRGITSARRMFITGERHLSIKTRWDCLGIGIKQGIPAMLAATRAAQVRLSQVRGVRFRYSVQSSVAFDLLRWIERQHVTMTVHERQAVHSGPGEVVDLDTKALPSVWEVATGGRY